MKCINCKGEWTPPLGITITECPFCKKPIEPSKTSEIYESAKEVLRFIIESYGAEALLTKNLFSDIAPNLSDERELIKMFREKGALDILKGALKSPGPEQSIAIKRAMGKLPSYLQTSTDAISLMNDFATALGWNVPLSSDSMSIPPQMLNVEPLVLPTQATNQRNSMIEIAPNIGSTMRFGDYDWRVLDVQKGQALLLSDRIIENIRYHSTLTAITWADCKLRDYLNGTFYNSFGQDKSRIGEVRNNNPNNLWYDTKGGSVTTDRIFLLSLEDVDKYFGNSGDYANKRRKKWSYNKFSSADDGYHITNHYDQQRIAKNTGGEKCIWWLRSPGDYDYRATYVDAVGTVNVSGYNVSPMYGGVRPALWLKL